MKKRLLLVAGALCLVAVLWFVLGGDAADHDSALEANSAKPADAPPPGSAVPAPSILTAPLPEATCELSIVGRVLGPQGPVAGAVVVATAGNDAEVLSELPCHCTPSCTNRLVECGCRHASSRVAELATARRGEAPPVARATSAEDGTFVISGLEPGAYALWAERPGILIGLRRAVNAGEQNVTVEISEGMVLRGRVVGDDEKPFAGAAVTAVFADHARFFDAVSDADGNYVIAPVPKGDFAVVATAAGMLPAHQSAEANILALPDLQLNAPRLVTGRVTSGGEPVAGVEVTLEEGHDSAWTITDAQGKFRIEHLRPADYDLVARKGLAYAARELRVEPGKDILDLVLELGRGGEIVGTVRSDSGTPLAGVELRAYPDGRESISDSSGRFRLGPLSKGTYGVVADGRGLITQRRDGIDVAEGQATTVDLVVRTAVQLRGMVVDPEGRPVADADLMARLRASRSDEAEGQHGWATSKRDGTFEIDGLIAGSFDLTSRHNEFLVRTEIVEAPGEELRIAMERGSEVAGTVLDAEARPVPGVSVRLLEDEELELEHERVGRRDLTDAVGGFRIKGLKRGDYVVLAVEMPERGRGLDGRMRTLRRVSEKVTVSGEGTPALELRFKGGEKISGRVLTSAGEPLEGVTVHAWPNLAGRGRKAGDGETTTLGVAVSGADGAFEVRDLVPGRYRLSASKEGFVDPADDEDGISVNTGDASVRLVLRIQGKVRGRVVDTEGKPIKHFTVDRRDHHDEKGSFELPVYREGERELVFVADGFASTNRRLTAKIGETFDLGDVVLTRGRALSGTVLDATTNEPVPEALVDIGDPSHRERLDSIRISEAAGAVKTGADGSFTLPRVDSTRPLVLFAYHESYRWWAEPLDPATSRVVIKLDRGGTVVGRVLDIDGSPIAEHDVVVKTGTAFKPGTTGEDGTFEIKGLPIGPATVIARPAGDYPIPARNTVIPGEGVAKVELREERGGARLLIRLVGSPGSRPRRPFLVPGTVAMPASLKELLASTATGIPGAEVEDQEATSEFRHVPAGSVTVFVAEPGAKARLYRHLIEVSGEPEQVFEIPVPDEFTVIPDVP